MAVKFEVMMRELFTSKERASIRRTAGQIAKRHMALRELRQARNRTQVSMAKRLGVKQVSDLCFESRSGPSPVDFDQVHRRDGRQLHLIVEFPEHEPVLLRNVGKTRAKAKGKGA